MTTPRIEVDLGRIRHNTRCLVGRLQARQITVTGVTKAVCGHPAVARAMLDGGAAGLADARADNVQRLRDAGLTCPVSLIRTPMLSQADQIVRLCDTSYNTEIDVIAALSAAALRAGTIHNIILMVEMGDMREGIMPKDLAAVAQHVAKMPGIALTGIGANFACLSGMVPDAGTLASLSALADETEGLCGPLIKTVSGGNSANLPWALETKSTGRINDLRLGEAILLGVDPVSGDQIDGLYTDAFTLIAEIIETKSKLKPPSFSLDGPPLAAPHLSADDDPKPRSVLAIGNQDTDTAGLTMPEGVAFLGATSDHLVIRSTRSSYCVGSTVRFQMNYSALMRAMAAPGIATTLLTDVSKPEPQRPTRADRRLVLV